MEITPIFSEDFDEIYTIETQAHSVPWTEGTLKNNQGERYLNLKITENNEILGFAISQFVLDEATLFNIAVKPQAQGKGIGRALLSALIEQLKVKNIATLWLEVRESNKKAKGLYESLGFNEVDIRKNYYPTPEGGRENAVVMACYL